MPLDDDEKKLLKNEKKDKANKANKANKGNSKNKASNTKAKNKNIFTKMKDKASPKRHGSGNEETDGPEAGNSPRPETQEQGGDSPKSSPASRPSTTPSSYVGGACASAAYDNEANSDSEVSAEVTGTKVKRRLERQDKVDEVSIKTEPASPKEDSGDRVPLLAQGQGHSQGQGQPEAQGQPDPITKQGSLKDLLDGKKKQMGFTESGLEVAAKQQSAAKPSDPPAAPKDSEPAPAPNVVEENNPGPDEDVDLSNEPTPRPKNRFFAMISILWTWCRGGRSVAPAQQPEPEPEDSEPVSGVDSSKMSNSAETPETLEERNEEARNTRPAIGSIGVYNPGGNNDRPMVGLSTTRPAIGSTGIFHPGGNNVGPMAGVSIGPGPFMTAGSLVAADNSRVRNNEGLVFSASGEYLGTMSTSPHLTQE